LTPVRTPSSARSPRSFAAIEPELYRFPAIDPASFRRAVEAVAAESA
jgi:hypothetical protein